MSKRAILKEVNFHIPLKRIIYFVIVGHTGVAGAKNGDILSIACLCLKKEAVNEQEFEGFRVLNPSDRIYFVP